MPKSVTFEQIQNTLTGFGFVPEPSGRHVLFRHAPTGAIISIPNVEKHVRPIYVSTASRMVENSGIATSTAFDAKLGELARR